MPSHYIDDRHTHPWHQIIFPLTGLLQSEFTPPEIEKEKDNEDRRVIVPHNAMLFIPANTAHKSVAVTDTQFLAVYLNPAGVVTYPTQPKSCRVTPFIKELILLLFDENPHYQAENILTGLLTVLSDQIDIATTYEIPLLIPSDRRLQSIFTQLQKQPDLKLSLAEWATKAGASERTLSRLCAKEFHQSFALWRQNIRLVLSLRLLDSGRSIQEIALESGYTSDSAYIHAFKGIFGLTPSRYRRDHLSPRADD
ncbi:HTH-type transcriptional repressor of iron proteins A [Vibrio quintilis]|uniref:HTH-type transcriptional repressor of iron proteins A n=2 Tax=Vibrio quintilis TaxID=1117707 RepID=A0A1M7YR24_9VIBR|nr:HTH-type transcriptional repressor of iron proteins A [Vibrio quintilis]